MELVSLIGLNSGVMLMNLTRMRQVNMVSKIMDIFDEYHLNITWGDQCLLNIYFSVHPGRMTTTCHDEILYSLYPFEEQVYEFSCEWNYRPDHCIYENNCHAAKLHGVKIVHGCRSAFHNDRYQEFKAIYQAVDQWKFDSNLRLSLLAQMKSNLKNYTSTNCGKSRDLFSKHLAKQISSLTHSPKNPFHIILTINDNWNLIDQSYVLVKSLLFFSPNKTNRIHLHVTVTDRDAQVYFSQQVKS